MGSAAAMKIKAKRFFKILFTKVEHLQLLLTFYFSLTAKKSGYGLVDRFVPCHPIHIHASFFKLYLPQQRGGQSADQDLFIFNKVLMKIAKIEKIERKIFARIVLSSPLSSCSHLFHSFPRNSLAGAKSSLFHTNTTDRNRAQMMPNQTD